MKGHRICFLEEKEANYIFKKIFKSLQIDKNKSQNLAKKKHSVVRIWGTQLASSLFYEEMFPENREENDQT